MTNVPMKRWNCNAHLTDKMTRCWNCDEDQARIVNYLNGY